jgi:hypothetical protein
MFIGYSRDGENLRDSMVILLEGLTGRLSIMAYIKAKKSRKIKLKFQILKISECMFHLI